jgi:4a-hydroxytetrahydrobiopterin dehydratase
MWEQPNLTERHCVPCEQGTAPLAHDDVARFLRDLDLDWAVEGNRRLRHEFRFPSFMAAMLFVNDVAAVAEEEGHHPDLSIYFTRVVVELTTHSIDGLSDNDFILARKIELVA